MFVAAQGALDGLRAVEPERRDELPVHELGKGLTRDARMISPSTR